MNSGPVALTLLLAGCACTEGSAQVSPPVEGAGHLALTRPPGGSQWTPSGIPAGVPAFFWYPEKGALRLGTSLYSSWVPSLIGERSVAFGMEARATQSGVFAFGDFSRADGLDSIALGAWSAAVAPYSIAIGGVSSEEIGAMAYGSAATAIGCYSLADGSGSVALQGSAGGWGAVSILGDAWSDRAIAIRGSSFGDDSLAIHGFAVSDRSVAIGSFTETAAPGSIALGFNNAPQRRNGDIADPFTAHALDPVFAVGAPLAGSGYWSYPMPTRRNLLTVYRDGVLEVRSADNAYTRFENAAGMSRTITVPALSGTLLLDSSTINAERVASGLLPVAVLPATVTRLGEHIDLDGDEVSGTLPWTRVSNRPSSLSGYGITDGLSAATVQECIDGSRGDVGVTPSGLAAATSDTLRIVRSPLGRISTPIRIEPQGDVSMGEFTAVP